MKAALKQAMIHHLIATIRQAELGRVLVDGDELSGSDLLEAQAIFQKLRDHAVYSLEYFVDDIAGVGHDIEFD
jgi:hypothetical protein